MLKRILSHSFWLLIANSIGRLAMFIANIFAARFLSQDVFGQFMMVRSTINVGGNIVSSALAATATKKISEIKQRKPASLQAVVSSLLIVNLVTTIFLALIILFFSEFITAHFFLGDSRLISALYLGIILLAGITFSTLIQGILVGYEQFKPLAILSIIVTFISIPIMLSLIYYAELYGAIIGVSFYYISDFLVKFGYLKTRIIKRKKLLTKHNLLKYSRNLITFSYPLVLSLIVNSIAFWYARVFILNNSKNFSDIAIFDAAYQWLTIIMLITGATSSVALAMLSNALGKNNRNEMSKIFYLNLLVNSIISIGIALIFIIFSKKIMSLYGPKYIQGSSILIILSISSTLFSISSLYNKYMIAHNKIWTVFGASLVGIIGLFIILDFTKGLKALGLAWAFFTYYGFSILTYIIADVINKYKISHLIRI